MVVNSHEVWCSNLQSFGWNDSDWEVGGYFVCSVAVCLPSGFQSLSGFWQGGLSSPEVLHDFRRRERCECSGLPRLYVVYYVNGMIEVTISIDYVIFCLSNMHCREQSFEDLLVGWRSADGRLTGGWRLADSRLSRSLVIWLLAYLRVSLGTENMYWWADTSNDYLAYLPVSLELETRDILPVGGWPLLSVVQVHLKTSTPTLVRGIYTVSCFSPCCVNCCRDDAALFAGSLTKAVIRKAVFHGEAWYGITSCIYF